MGEGQLLLGILVYGDNHLILRGPQPSIEEARMLARRTGMSMVSAIGNNEGLPEPWRISTREFRENLKWAVVLEAGTNVTAGVQQLLDELLERGVEIEREVA